MRRLKAAGIPLKIADFAKDLGVASTAGVKRISSVLAIRFMTARNRVKRIRALNRVNKSASKLFNKGAWPQSIYGKEAMGLPGTGC